MDYCLGADDGAAMMYHDEPALDVDGDGRLDAVSLDLDGDGLRDDALVDLDGDGIADHALFDVGRGSQLRWFGLDGLEHVGGPLVDFQGHGDDGGTAHDRLLDTNGDGLADQVLVGDEHGLTGYLDTDGDGRWNLRLTDTDGDGLADGAAVL